jgi:hypothetical protein
LRKEIVPLPEGLLRQVSGASKTCANVGQSNAYFTPLKRNQTGFQSKLVPPYYPKSPVRENAGLSAWRHGSIGDYWRSIFNILEERRTVVLANPAHRKSIRPMEGASLAVDTSVPSFG